MTKLLAWKGMESIYEMLMHLYAKTSRPKYSLILSFIANGPTFNQIYLASEPFLFSLMKLLKHGDFRSKSEDQSFEEIYIRNFRLRRIS